MTATAVKSKAKAGPVPAQAAEPPPPAAPSRRRGMTPLTPMRREAAKRMRVLAAQVQDSHPDMTVHEHLRDAARTLEAGNEEGAQRHLRAAMFALTPQSLMRNGLHTDDSHVAARDAMHSVHRHLLLVKDITDVAAKNQEALRRDSYGDDVTSNPPPVSPVRADPNAGYGPGALAQKPTARQPPGNQALNAPARSSGGGSDPAVADPVGPQPKGSKQFTTWDEVCAVVDLAVPPQAVAYGWGDLVNFIEMAVQPAKTGTIDIRTPATAGTARGRGRPDESRPTWPRIRRTTSDTTGSTAFAARPGISDARTAADGRATGPRSTAGQARMIPLTTGPSADPATAYTTAAPGASSTALLNSPNSRSWQSMLAEPRGRQSWPESLGSANPLSAASPTAGTGPGSLELSAQKPSCTTRESSPLIKSGRSDNGQARLPRRSPASSAYRNGPSVLSAAARRTATLLDLSAQTAALERTPAPRGKLGGPGLYDVAGNKHSDYMEQIVKGLIEKRGMPPGKAYAIAWGALRKWARGGGKVTPEVSAAASKALGQEAAASAKAHAHAASWDQVSRDIELATVLEFFNPAQPRLPVGPGGGQFAGGAAAPPPGGQQPAGKAPAKTQPKPPPTAAQLHALHIAHVAHVNRVSTAKAGFMVTAADDRAKASALIKQRDALAKALASAGGKVSAGQAGAKTAKTAKTKTTAHTAKNTKTPATAKPAAASSKTRKTATAKSAAAKPSASASAPKATSTAGIKAQIIALNTQISALLAQAKQADAQAAKAK